MTINKVSQAVAKQTPQFIDDYHPLFNKFLEYYYKSQEKTGFGQNILNEFLNYLDIDKLNIDILGGATKIVSDAGVSDSTIIVENVDKFLEKDGSILIGDEVIYYERAIPSPSVALSPGVSYEQVKLRWRNLASILDQFDGTTRRFALISQESPVSPPSTYHVIVSLFGRILSPDEDYVIDGDDIVFTEAPRERNIFDDTNSTYITYLNGFIEDTIYKLDNISPSFGEGKKIFSVTRNGDAYSPIVDEYTNVIYDGTILTPKEDYTFDRNQITFNFVPVIGRRCTILSIESAIPTFGSGAVGFSRVSETGELTSIEVNQYGSNYRFEYPPKVTITDNSGSNASVKPLIDGIRNVNLIAGGLGYSDTNPPIVVVEPPTKDDGKSAVIEATVTNGSVTGLNIISSGSGYTFTPRVTFLQPGGAELQAPQISLGQVLGPIVVTNPGRGYTTPPKIYIDQPTGENAIPASLVANLNAEGGVESITILNPGQGYENPPRIAVIDPVLAQVLEVKVDGEGRVIDIEMLDGGGGYVDIPSVYIVDDRVDDIGVYIGGRGATAVASIFNGQITDINITNFGTGYSADHPPKVYIQSPPTAAASVETGLGQVTGFEVINPGSGYERCRFEGCARAASGIIGYTEDGNALFSGDTRAQEHKVDSEVKCLDSLFIKRLLDKYIETYLPDIPQLDYESIDVRPAIKNIKTFYSTKGTAFSISYLFKLLYGENISISYPKDQITKPSAATWSINTILRATLVSGDPSNINDALIQQFADIADTNVRNASALVENFISIKTSDVEIYELVLSEETIQGSFTVPYKTKLAEPIGATTGIITVDSTIGWPERNGEFIIGGGETIRYKEKSLNQFIECTRGVSGTPREWDSATEVTSNFKVYLNKDTAQEVVMNIVGIVDAQQTVLTDTGSYYLPGDKLSVSKLGGTSIIPQLTTWLYNVKKLIEVDNITFGGVNNQSATVTCSAPHGLLVGDQVTVYGANPILYNGTFLVTSRDSQTVFQYRLPQPAAVTPQGNILISVDLNKGKSENQAINNSINPYTTNVQNAFFNTDYVYVASTGIPNYNIGPFIGSALLPGNQRKLNRFNLNPLTISTKTEVVPGPIGTWINGVSIWSYKSTETKTFGAITSVDIDNPGFGYDAANPPNLTFIGGGGTGARASVTVDGSIFAIEVENGGSGYTSSPLVSIVGGGGSGAAATAIITKGEVSRILINDGGSGYTSRPEITIVGGGGRGATATAQVRGPIRNVDIIDGGSSYTSTPQINISSGVGAVAQAIVNDGRIISIAIISGGNGYTTAPEVSIQGDGFGAVARAIIDTDGENAGKVTGVEILNKGIGYSQGTTVINLTSIGREAEFTANVFQWVYNLQETTEFDAAKGSVFQGYNIQYGGEYAHLSNPQRLRYVLGDNLFVDTIGRILEQEDQLEHSPIVGWAFDGNPIYGPYGYEDPTNQSSNVTRMRSSYSLKSNLVFNDITNPYPERIDGPPISEETPGKFIEDYQYVFGSGDLDQYNGRFCKTPEFPEGRYCYFVTIDATENGNPVFPYIMGPSYNSIVDTWNLRDSAVQQNIPTGVVRYRDPYENVDIDVERTPNASTNALTTEEGFIIVFEAEDENRDGVITQDEIDDPEEMYEESPLQLFDYFPKVRFDSKVDIEVETTTKFENASVTGFTVENPGINYQVNDRLIFDNTGTDGTGASARVSKIVGENIASLTYETVDGINYGILQTETPHNLVAADKIFLDYTPIMDNTNKQFVVRQYRGIEEIVVNQTGSGYNTDIPPTIIIDGDGESGSIEAVVSSVGSISEFNIINSGNGYTTNPRVILSHPQVFKKADYYAALLNNNDFVSINDSFVTTNKEVYVCGSTKTPLGNEIGFVAKLSATGVLLWQQTLESSNPPGGPTKLEYKKIYVDGKNVWVVGNDNPNISVLSNYNPDLVLVKYTEADNGLSASLSFQKAYAGISGSTREDSITTLKKLSDTRFIIGGFTNTNSNNPYDAFIAIIDTTGSFAAKRKLASSTDSEKLTDITVVDSNTVYFTLEVSDTAANSNKSVAFGKMVINNIILTVPWIYEISNSAYSFLDSNLTFDEFNEFYVSATLRQKSDHTTKDSFWVGKFNSDGQTLWNKRYLASGRDINLVSKSKIDIFGDLNLAYTKTDITTGFVDIETVKIKYDGTMISRISSEFIPDSTTTNNIEGFVAKSIDTDVSGDLYVYGQSLWNRNEALVPFDADETDITDHHSITALGTNGSLAIEDGVAKIYGYQPSVGQSTWENSYIKVPGATLREKLNGNWSIEFLLYKDSANSQTLSQTKQTLIGIGGAQDPTGGLLLSYDIASGALTLIISNNTTALNLAGGTASNQVNMFANNTWQLVTLTKEGSAFRAWINGIEVISGNVTNTDFGDKDVYIGNQIGWGAGANDFSSAYQGQYYVNNLRIRNRYVAPTVPSDIVTLPSANAFPFAYDWSDDAWFANYTKRYDYINYSGLGLKVDKNSDVEKLGDRGVLSNTKLHLARTNRSVTIGSELTLVKVGFALGSEGIQSLDFNDANTFNSINTQTLTGSQDIWASRTATIPSPGSQKVSVTAVVKDRYFFKVTDTVKIDNIQRLTINQSFKFSIGGKLELRDSSGVFVNSGYIIEVDSANNYVYLAINNNDWSNDLNTGNLSTTRFDEQSTFGIRGPFVNDINEIEAFVFPQVNNTTPGTFNISLSDYDNPEGGTQNLDEFAKFKSYSDDDYAVRIDEISGVSPYIPGSVITLNSTDVSFNADYDEIQITNLTAVSKITLITNLRKILQVTSVSNSDRVYVITDSSHYLSEGEIIYVDGNPSQEVNNVVYNEYNGSFAVENVISVKEFTYRLPQTALTSPSLNAGEVDIFVKSPTLKMYYGHQYIFDLSHSSLVGGNLSFSKDNLYKLEYSFNSIERIGTPGVTGQGQPTPSVKFKVEEGIVTNISYYFDPSRTGDDSPVIRGSYLDVVDSPYVGVFDLTGVSGGTITRGDDTMRFVLQNEPEGAADVSRASYSTSSLKAVGSIADIRIVNPGGFYTRLPIVSAIQSTRNIERIQINEPGTEYYPGQYNNVPISGDGEGGFVSITVEDTSDDEGNTIPGQITTAIVTSPGKGYTTAFIDIESIPGILGPSLAGSGADLEVVIPPFGTGASIFTKGVNVGKIKKLKSNNFGYDYPHDYTLRPEITFPLNLQLTSTSILESITVTNPGSGYSQPPIVVITGGGGSGATAEATIKNGRLDQIIVKDPGAGYSSTPTIELKSSFNYVVNLDLGLLQFAFPHGIPNGSPVTLNVVDTGDGAEFPLSAGAIGRLNGSTTYYAISGAAQSLDDDQLRLAITQTNAELGDAINFVNAGTGRQQILTSSFGGDAEANVVTSTFLEGELVYQGTSLEVATATGYVSTNAGWQVGPRILKVVDYVGEFVEGEKITGVVSKSSGIISDLQIAKGVLEIGSITKTTGQFIDDVGKPSEIVQKIQDSYYYQDFSYAVKSSVSIGEWKNILIKNVHPASFKVFGELNLEDYTYIPNKTTDFELTKSVELSQSAIVPNIQNFALVEPIYQEFNNTEVLFRQKRLTSSENILTSVVQRLDDISNLFDGIRISFPLTVDGETVVANSNQLMIILNGVVQTPEVAFQVQNDQVVFSEPPAPPASVKYVEVTIETIDTKTFTFTNISGIFPNIGNTLIGTDTGARAKVTNVIGDTIIGFVEEGTFAIGELTTVNATGFAANLNGIADIDNNGLFIFNEQVTNFTGDTAIVEEINLDSGQETPIAKLRFGIGTSTTQFEVVNVTGSGFSIGENYQLSSEIFTVTDVVVGSESTTLTVSRGQLGTRAIAHLQNAPIYSTQITITDHLILSKTTGTYQSTPGLFDIQLDDIIIAAGSGVVARITSTTPYQDDTTGEFIPQVNISDGSSFFGLLFNRITSTEYPNVVLDDISTSQISIVDYNDNASPFDSRFPANELLNNYVIVTDDDVSTFVEGEEIRSKKFEFGNASSNFVSGEDVAVRKLTFKNREGSGFFSPGQVIRSSTSKAEIIGYNQARSTIYLGKLGRSTGTGEDHHIATFNNSAQLSTSQKKFGLSSLLLNDATADYLLIPTSTDFGFGTGDFTIECWIRPDDVSSGDRHIVDMRDSGSDSAGRLYVATNQLRYAQGGSDIVTSGATTLSADTWYHVAVSRSGTSLKLFVDGNEVGSTTNGTNLGSTKRVFIGANFAGSNAFSGYIDEIRVSTSARYTTAFGPRSGMHQGDASTVLLLHLDGENGQTYADDWSGVATWTNGDQFANDSILATTRQNSGDTPAGFTGKSFRYLDAANLLLSNKNFIASELVYQLENSSPYAPFSVPTGSQNCIDDVVDIIEELAEDLRHGSNSHIWDASNIYVDRTANPVTLNHIETEIDETLWVYGQLITFAQNVINNQTITVTGDHGLTQTFNNTLTDSGDDSNGAYTSNDCADVKDTIDNLISILLDTLSEAQTPTNTLTGDHLGTVTRVTPAYEYLGGYVDGFYEVPTAITSVNNQTEIFYANRIDTDDRNRFYDAANLIRLNRAVILDKAAYDLLDRYPDLALDMPRNEDGTGSGTLRCKTDLGLILDNLAKDIEVGGNFNTITAIRSYLGQNDEIQHIRLQLLQSLYAHTRLGYYMKQAITGDLDYTNTDSIIVGDWGITNDPAGCANVQTAIDNLIDLANDMLAPTGDRYRDAGDLIYFNIDYIAEEALGILDTDFTYNLGPTSYTGFFYPDGVNGRNRCKLDIELILKSIISDLLTGGNSNTVKAIEFYVNANRGITFVEDQLLATIYAFQKVKFLGSKAINNLLYDRSGITPNASAYSAQYTFLTPYRDETITDSNGDGEYTTADCADVVSAYESLWDSIIDTLTPSDSKGRGSGRMILFNRYYYREELITRVEQQWGSGSWTYNEFLDTLVDDLIHDIATTDTSSDNISYAYDITLEDITGTFVVDETVTSSSGGTAVVKEFYPDKKLLVIGFITGNAWAAGNTVTGATASATISAGGVGSLYEFYDTVSNVQTLATARNIQSTVDGQVSNLNLWTNPEALEINWSTGNTTWSANAGLAPDDTQTADKIIAANSGSAARTFYRDYSLTSYDTFDDGSIRFDSTGNTFDEGSNTDTQTYTLSMFFKADEYGLIRFRVQLDPSGNTKSAFFDININDGSFASIFTPQGGLTVDDYGVIPHGEGWYRAYVTLTFSFGISTIRHLIDVKNASGALTYAGDGTSGMYIWGAKLSRGSIDPYISQSGEYFYSDDDFNIKSYILQELSIYLYETLTETLVSPSPNSGFISYTNPTLSATYTPESIQRIIRYNLNIIQQQLILDSYIEDIDTQSGIVIPASTYGTRVIPVPLGGGINSADNVYGLYSDTFAEVEAIFDNEAKIVKIYQRMRIAGEIIGDFAFLMNESVYKQGNPSLTGVIYGYYEDENFVYLDIETTAGTWSVGDIIVGSEQGTTAEIASIQNRIQVIDLFGEFAQNIPFRAFTSNTVATVSDFLKVDAAVLTNVGGKLVVDTASLNGSFEKTSVVYPENSRIYMDVSKFDGFDVAIGNRIASTGHIRLGINVINNLDDFQVGRFLYNVIGGVLRDQNNYGIITEVDLDNNYIYVSQVAGQFSNGNLVGDYGSGINSPVGYASVTTKVTYEGAGSGIVQDIVDIGLSKRLFISDIVGEFNGRDTIISTDGYKAAITSLVELKARVRRSFRGFDGVQTNFKLTTNNGDPYFPDPAGHLLVFINGILQPPGQANAFTAFSDEIQFTEAPSLGSGFTGFYIGKLRQLDDISFDFDSLRQSFNLKRNGVFYSLTLTEGVQSTTIRPENNIIVSLNGVIQEPGVGFEIVGSRIIFSEIPRVGSTFVAFSYIGSDQDVEAADVVPPIETGDFIDIQGEILDREVAVIESSNSLITFDYLGSVFGKGAQARADLLKGTLDKVSVTAGGSGYTSRPNVRVDSISGFDAQIKALVGVAGVVLSNPGSGYKKSEVTVETTVPDDWTPPNLDDYGEEVIDPEIL